MYTPSIMSLPWTVHRTNSYPGYTFSMIPRASFTMSAARRFTRALLTLVSLVRVFGCRRFLDANHRFLYLTFPHRLCLTMYLAMASSPFSSGRSRSR